MSEVQLSVPALRLLVAANPEGAKEVLTKTFIRTLGQKPPVDCHALLEEIVSGLDPYVVFRYRNWMRDFVTPPELNPKNWKLLAKLRRAIEVERGSFRLKEGDFVRHGDLERSIHHFDGSARTFKRALSLALKVGALYHHSDEPGRRYPINADYEVGRILPKD